MHMSIWSMGRTVAELFGECIDRSLIQYFAGLKPQIRQLSVALNDMSVTNGAQPLSKSAMIPLNDFRVVNL